MGSPRRILRRLLKPYVPSNFYQGVVLKVDDRVDSALDLLETEEEPALLDWLTIGDGEDLLRTHSASIKAALIEGSQRNLHIDAVMKRLDGLAYRMASTVAVETTYRVRGDEIGGLVDGS